MHSYILVSNTRVKVAMIFLPMVKRGSVKDRVANLSS